MRRPLPLALVPFLVAACGHSAPRVSPAAASPVPPIETGPSSPEVLVSGSSDFEVKGLSADARFIYVAHSVSKGIVRVSFSGGLPVTLVPGSEALVTSLASDAAYLYFTSGRHVETEVTPLSLVPRITHVEHFEGVVSRVRKEGSSKVDEISSGRFKPEDIAASGAYVYWIMAKKDATLVRQPLGQIDAPEVVAHGHFEAGSLVVAGGYAYWIDTDVGPAVMRVGIHGGEPQKVAQSAGAIPMHPARLAADESAVYVSDVGPMEGKGSILRVPPGASAPSKVAEDLSTPRDVAVHGGYVYWLNKGTVEKNFKDGSLEKAPASGGPKVTMATDLAAPDRIAVTDSRVVWTEIDGTVKDMGR